MVFPLITFPYASRILDADGIGLINFYSSIISYISLVTCLGIPLYATREIAKVKHDPSLISKKSAEILFLHILLTLIGYIAIIILCFLVPKIREDYVLFLILSASLIFTAMGCEWYFRGTEDFKFITIRGLICRIIYIPLLFIFVKSKNDLLIYGILTVFVTVGNNLFNFYKISSIIKLKELKEAVKVPTRHLKGSVEIFILSASISLYLQLNILILGFISTATNVGYYVAASRVTTIVAGIITALQTTLLPRSASLLAQDNLEAFKTTLYKVMNFIVCFSLPMSAGLIVMAPLIIKLFAGDTFLAAIPTCQILSFNLILSIYNGFLCGGILIPGGHEKKATFACLIGGGVNLILNFILIPFLAQNGAAIASVFTEFAVLFGMLGFGYKYIPISLWKRSYWNYCISTVIMFIVCVVSWHFVSHEAFRLVAIPFIGIFTYLFLLNVMKDRFYLDLQKSIIDKLHFSNNH